VAERENYEIPTFDVLSSTKLLFSPEEESLDKVGELGE
jgi:hypothetical protein